MVKLEISLKRVQTFIFDVPRLKVMLGANALLGETMRYELPKLMNGRGCQLLWPEIDYDIAGDPLDNAPDAEDRDNPRDNPKALYEQGILARDGGHFIAVFSDEDKAKDFLKDAEQVLAEKLPGVLYDCKIESFEEKKTFNQPKSCENHLLNLPVFQVCQETGKEPASETIQYEEEQEPRWVAKSVQHRRDHGSKFYEGKTKDIIGLMWHQLYPDPWQRPQEIKDLTSGGYLALIHADGNCIGLRYNKWKEKQQSGDALTKEAHGETFFHSMRVAVRKAVVAALNKTFVPEKSIRPYEVLMLGGDDLLLACHANKALTFARHYVEELQNEPLADGNRLDVAIGVAIAKPSYPLHRLHELAENLASGAKRLYRASEHDRNSVIDWQVVTQSWFAGVEEVRQKSEVVQYKINDHAETLLLTGRPYRVVGGEHNLQQLLDTVNALDNNKKIEVARSPLRSLRNACEQGRLSGKMAFERLPKEVRQELGNNLWQSLSEEQQTSIYLTRVLDIIGIREIAHLGSRKNDG
ncbi:MAG: hypothetical protein HQL58_11105 [Magnetococcales bacterium]|nr:hypothetical protein [Magnetococcales bacterium]